jgi:hypothetical protein
MDDLLHPFAEEMKQFRDRIDRHDLIDTAAMLWKIVYGVVYMFQQRHDDWIFIRHEDLARSPVESFEALYKSLGLPFTESIRSAIADHSGGNNSVNDEVDRNRSAFNCLADRLLPGTGAHIRRDSRSIIDSWKARLTPGEIRRVRERTEPVARHFYSAAEW